MLPPDSRLAKAESPELEWDVPTYILSTIEHDLRVIAWQRTEDGQKGRNYPKHMTTPLDRERERRAELSSTPEMQSMVADKLGIPEDRR